MEKEWKSSTRQPYSYKRIFAYLLDVIIIAFIGVLIGYFIPVTDEYKEASEKFQDIVEKFGDEEIDQETYLEQINDISYDLSKESIATSIITVVLYLGYFVVLPYYNNGQTLGKRIMKIKITSNDNRKLTMNNYLVRALIVDSILSSIISVITILVLNKTAYITTSEYVSNFFTSLYIVIFAMILFRKDGRGAHDFIANTKVVATDVEEVEEASVIEEVKDTTPVSKDKDTSLETRETKDVPKTKQISKPKKEIKEPIKTTKSTIASTKKKTSTKEVNNKPKTNKKN